MIQINVQSYADGLLPQVSPSAPTESQKKVVDPKKPMTQEEIKDFLKKYQPGKVTAVPPMMAHQASQLSLLRQLQNRTNMTRREITENRIINNILIHNDPKEA